MKVQPTTKELIAMLYERLPELFDRAAPVKEPVAWMYEDDWGRTKIAFSKETANDWGTEVQPLYTTPPAAQRQWVGLTDEEAKDALISVDAETRRLPPGFKDFARAIEAKLKEKNT
jgi:hypothetical protein